MTAEPVAWLNGRFLPLSQASLSVLDAGVTTGATVTERLRTFRHEPFLLDEHLSRLVASAEAAYIPLAFSAAAIEDVVREVVRQNAASVPSEDDLTISLFATAGTVAGPTLCTYATPLPARLYAAGYEAGVRLVTPATHAVPADTLSPQIKTRNRLHWHVAEAQADRFDPGARALLLDRDGFVTETATGNMFLVPRDGKGVVTPRRSRTLHGLSQWYVFGLLPRFDETDLHLADVLAAAEVFVTSSVYCLLPVVAINRTPIGDGRPGPVYRKLLAAWSEAVGVDIAGQMQQMASRP